MRIDLIKYQALGNDYLVLDLPAPLDAVVALLPRLCDRNFGLGSDGLLAFDPSRMSVRIFNPDSSEAQKSGNGLRITAAHAVLEHGAGESFDLHTVGRVNDLAYGNVDARLERTLTTLEEGLLRGYRADLNGAPAAVALALHHGSDCGVSFVATVPQARRRGLATQVMHSVLADARANGLETITLQATEQGERLYQALGLRRLGPMELWERRW